MRKNPGRDNTSPPDPINVMVKLIDPQPGEKCNDPAAGTFGFMIAADHYLREKNDQYYDLESQQKRDFQKYEAFTRL